MHPAREIYSKLLRRHFPPVDFAFAYGSAVFKQHGREKGKMLDLIFAVDDPLKWHEENIRRNPHHYSSLRYLGSETVAGLQKLSAGVYYNTLVKVESQLLKYGVISVEDLLDDLFNWKWLYISGRLHKPVLFLSDVDRRIQTALEYNLGSAVTCALLCLKKPQFSTMELYMAITSLSYQGDFRMIVGEDKHKVRNIVAPNMPHFSKLYEPYTNALLEESTNGLLYMKEPVNVDDLPSCIQRGVQEGNSVEYVLSRIVSESSFKQSAKGILTAGITKTLWYSFEKLLKMAKSL